MTALLMPLLAAASLQSITIDASNKENFQYYSLQEGQLTAVTKDDPWIFAVRRYIFQTHTGSNGSFTGGAYAEDIAGFDKFAACDATKFEADQEITMLGYTISANTVLTGWFDYNDQGALVPFPQFYAIGLDQECIKLKIDSYAAGIYQIQYQTIP